MTFRVATVTAIVVQVGLGAVSNVLFIAAYQGRPEWFADPALVVTGGSFTAELFKWASLTDLASYYLPTAVVAMALWVAVGERRPVLATVATAAALGYVLIGGAGAAALAMAGAPLIIDYYQPGADRVAIAVIFGMLIDVVFRAIWQLLDGILLAVWFLATGLLVARDRPGFARLSILLGGLIAAGTALNVVGLALVRDIGLGLVFILWAAWSVWLAMLVWRRRPPFDVLDAEGHGP